MTTKVYPLDKPRPAASRGGDCRLRDLSLGENQFGPHRFQQPEDVQIDNGLIRMTLSAEGTITTWAVEVWRGPLVIGDTYDDSYEDVYEAAGVAVPDWLSVGSLVLDSPTPGLGLLFGAAIQSITPERVSIRLDIPDLGGAWVALRRGERMCRVQFGNSRPPLLNVGRRVTWDATPSPVGIAQGRVEEVTPPPGLDGLVRFLAPVDPMTLDAAGFSLTATSDYARFGAGVGTYAAGDRPSSYHAQLGDVSRVHQEWCDDDEDEDG